MPEFGSSKGGGKKERPGKKEEKHPLHESEDPFPFCWSGWYRKKGVLEGGGGGAIVTTGNPRPQYEKKRPAGTVWDAGEGNPKRREKKEP